MAKLHTGGVWGVSCKTMLADIDAKQCEAVLVCSCQKAYDGICIQHHTTQLIVLVIYLHAVWQTIVKLCALRLMAHWCASWRYELWAALDYDKTGYVSLREISEAHIFTCLVDTCSRHRLVQTIFVLPRRLSPAARKMPVCGLTSRLGLEQTSADWSCTAMYCIWVRHGE